MAKKNKLTAFNPNVNFGVDPEALDFSQDIWSWKGDVPSYAIQSDGFSYDIVDEDGNDRNAISLGILGMIIILYNTKSAKIKEEEVQPPFKEVLATRNWNTVAPKDANQMGKVAIAKLVDQESSGDVFNLASYAPLEIKRALLKKLFVIARHRLQPEYRDEAERRITEDIVPLIFANPEVELALLTGLIVKPKQAAEPAAAEAPAPVFAVEEAAEVEINAADEALPIDEVEAVEEVEPIVIPDRDADEALKEHMEKLTKAVPNLPPEKPADDADSGYVPFSDMEKDLGSVQGMMKAAPVEPVSVPEPFGDDSPRQAPQPVSAYPKAQVPPMPPVSQPVQPHVPPVQSAYPQKAQVPPPVMPNVARPPMPPASGQYYAPPAYAPAEQQPVPPVSHYPEGYAPYPPYPQQPGYPPVAGYGQMPPVPQPPKHGNAPQEPPAIEHTQPRKVA